MNLTEEINQAIARISSEDHNVHKGLRDSLFDSVGPVFDKAGEEAFFPLRPSGCLKPMRDLYYDLVNYYAPNSIGKKPFEPRIKLIFQFGHVTETMLKTLFAHNFEVLFEQHRVCYGTLTDKDGKEFKLTGAIDWATKLTSSSSAITLVDAKSIGDYPFKTAPKEDNIAQMQLYMHSDWGRAYNVNKAILVYFNKNTSDIKCIEIDYDAGLAEKILQRLYSVYDYYKRGEVPPREYLAGLDWRADYSSYKDYDNEAFLATATRKHQAVNDFYKGAKNAKDEIREFVKKYDSDVVKFVDITACVIYSEGKLTLTHKENR